MKNKIRSSIPQRVVYKGEVFCCWDMTEIYHYSHRYFKVFLDFNKSTNRRIDVEGI